jgi:hypothetical protein
MNNPSAWTTPSHGPRARRGGPGHASASGDHLDRDALAINDLIEARYRHHLATGFAPDLAVVLAEWDVVGYLRVTGANRTDRHDRP